MANLMACLGQKKDWKWPQVPITVIVGFLQTAPHQCSCKVQTVPYDSRKFSETKIRRLYVHQDVFCEDIDNVGIMYTHETSSAMERLTQQSYDQPLRVYEHLPRILDTSARHQSEWSKDTSPLLGLIILTQ